MIHAKLGKNDVIKVTDGLFGFIEGRARIHNTLNNVERKAMFMPCVEPIRCLGEETWGLESEKLATILPCPVRTHRAGPCVERPV